MVRDRSTALVVWGPPATALAAFVLFALVAPASSSRDDVAPAAPLWPAFERVARLVPIGDLPWRLRLGSMVAGALAVWWTARLVTSIAREPGGDPDAASAWGGITAGALLASAFTFVRDATAIGATAATVAALAAAAVLIDRAAIGRDPRPGLTLALACGLGVGLGRPFLWIVPVAIALAIVRSRRERLWRFAPALLATAAAGALVVLAIHPAPHVLADAHAGTGAIGIRRLGDDVVDSLGPVGVLAAVWGAVALWRRRRLWPAIALTTVAAADLAWTLTRGGDGAPLIWAGAAAAGLGAAALVRLTGRFAPAAGAGVATLCILPAAVLSLPLL